MAVKEIKDMGAFVLTRLKKQAKETGINVPKLEASDLLQNFKVSQMQILDSFSPTYEFD